jgi:hypothetical protein
MLSPPIATNVGSLKQNPFVVKVDTNAAIKTDDKYLLAIVAIVIMNAY